MSEEGAKSSTIDTAQVKVEDDKKGGGGGMSPVVGLVALAIGLGAGIAIGYGIFFKEDPPIAGPGSSLSAGTNICLNKKPTGPTWDDWPCKADGVIQAIEQAGADVTDGYVGAMNTTASPITVPYYQAGLCPVNVHWHLGTEHRSAGQYDEAGTGPAEPASGHRRQLGGAVRLGLRCHHYNANDAKFTQEYDWKHCVGMKVGETYEIHWPHSAAGACGTINQYQSPFYDGVFCSDTAVGLVLDGTIAVEKAIGVQGQVFTIVNDENYYYPDLIRGMIVDGEMGKNIAAYTGSTTGTSRSNTVCSKYAPITWQVDRTCHLISASSFDKMCADMKGQRDDMADDMHAHGSRELVSTPLAANNQGSNVVNGLFRE